MFIIHKLCLKEYYQDHISAEVFGNLKLWSSDDVAFGNCALYYLGPKFFQNALHFKTGNQN